MIKVSKPPTTAGKVTDDLKWVRGLPKKHRSKMNIPKVLEAAKKAGETFRPTTVKGGEWEKDFEDLWERTGYALRDIIFDAYNGGKIKGGEEITEQFRTLRKK